MKVSVIVVTLNAADYLLDTLSSIFSQDYKDLEVIVVDGGSTDSTLSIIEGFSEKIDIWLSEKDRGIYDAMNKGVGLASGDYVVFMNSGDCFYKKESVSNIIRGIPVDFSGVFYGRHVVVGRDGKAPDIKPPEQLWKGMICCHQSMFFKRDVLGDEKYDLDFGTAGDFELIFRLYKKNFDFLACYNQIVAFYRPGGVSDRKRIRSLLDTFRISREYSDKPFLLILAYYAFRICRESLAFCFKWALKGVLSTIFRGGRAIS